MKPTELLKKEHEEIRSMLEVVANMASRLEAGEDVDPDDLEAAIAFIRGFADSYHHAKEEDLLFPAMEDAGFPREGGPIAVMLAEHDEGRDAVRRMDEGLQRYRQGDRSFAAQIAQGALDYAGLLDQHIEKENQALYPMSDDILDGFRERELTAAFERVNADETRAAEAARHRETLARLRTKYLGT